MTQQQQDLDADVTTIQEVLADVVTQTGNLTAANTALTAYIQQLVAGEQTLDLTQLDQLAQAATAAQQGLDPAVAAAAALVPATPAPAPAG